MNIGVLGIGLMGHPIAIKLNQASFNVVAYNRTDKKLSSLAEADIKTTTDINVAIACSDYLLLTLSDASAIESVLFKVKPDSLQGKTVIQMGTIAPEESKKIAAHIAKMGGQYLEAPVLGSIPQVKTGTLLVMVGGEQKLFEQCLPILKVLGAEPKHIGAVGTAAALKLALNQLIASLTAGFSLSLGLVQKEGVDLEKFMEILRESAIYAPTFDKKLQRMCDRQFENPNFPTKHLLKDTNLFLQAADDAGLNAGGLVGIRDVIQQAIAANLSNEDYSSIYNVIVPEADT